MDQLYPALFWIKFWDRLSRRLQIGLGLTSPCSSCQVLGLLLVVLLNFFTSFYFYSTFRCSCLISGLCLFVLSFHFSLLDIIYIAQIQNCSSYCSAYFLYVLTLRNWHLSYTVVFLFLYSLKGLELRGSLFLLSYSCVVIVGLSIVCICSWDTALLSEMSWSVSVMPWTCSDKGLITEPQTPAQNGKKVPSHT